MQRNIIFIVTTVCWPPSSDEGRKKIIMLRKQLWEKKIVFSFWPKVLFCWLPTIPMKRRFILQSCYPLFFSSTCCDPWHSLLFSEAYSREQTQIVQKIISEHNGSDFVFAEDPEAKKELWKVPIFNCSTLYWILFFCLLWVCGW